MSGSPPKPPGGSPQPTVVPGAPRWVGDHDTFAPIFQGPRTDISMSVNAVSHNVSKYRNEVNGIVPGYQGHVPRSRDQFGESAVGGLKPDAWNGQRHMGASVGHYVNAQGQSELTQDEKKHQAEEDRFANYRDRNGGVMANYAGHRPGARGVEARSAFSQVVRPGKPASQQFNDTADYTGKAGNSAATTGTQDSYRKQVGGIVPGYKGFVPGAIDKAGGSHYGGVAGVDRTTGLNMNRARVDGDGDFFGLEQKGHGRDHKEQHTAGAVKSGYAGHLPGARDTWGQTHYESINMGADGRLHGRERFVNDGGARPGCLDLSRPLAPTLLGQPLIRLACCLACCLATRALSCDPCPSCSR